MFAVFDEIPRRQLLSLFSCTCVGRQVTTAEGHLLGIPSGLQIIEASELTSDTVCGSWATTYK
jgi:hypothetical protein